MIGKYGRFSEHERGTSDIWSCGRQQLKHTLRKRTCDRKALERELHSPPSKRHIEQLGFLEMIECWRKALDEESVPCLCHGRQLVFDVSNLCLHFEFVKYNTSRDALRASFGTCGSSSYGLPHVAKDNIVRHHTASSGSAKEQLYETTIYHKSDLNT